VYGLASFQYSVVGLASFQLYFDSESASDSGSVLVQNWSGFGIASFQYFESDSDSASD